MQTGHEWGADVRPHSSSGWARPRSEWSSSHSSHWQQDDWAMELVWILWRAENVLTLMGIKPQTVLSICKQCIWEVNFKMEYTIQMLLIGAHVMFTGVMRHMHKNTTEHKVCKNTFQGRNQTSKLFLPHEQYTCSVMLKIWENKDKQWHMYCCWESNVFNSLLPNTALIKGINTIFMY